MDINKIKSTIVDYNQTCELFDKIINHYVVDNLEHWKNFNGWSFSDNGEKIILHYTYEDFCGNTETCTESDSDVISMETILNFYNEQGEKNENI